ncbi:hypothetical protein Tco_1502965 [Tanacetum coccineum]
MDQLSSGIFTSSSYDEDFRATLTNLAPAVETQKLTNPIGAMLSLDMFMINKGSIIQTNFIVCLLAFLSQLEPTSKAKALEDPDWVDAMQEEFNSIDQPASMELLPTT